MPTLKITADAAQATQALLDLLPKYTSSVSPRKTEMEELRKDERRLTEDGICGSAIEFLVLTEPNDLL